MIITLNLTKDHLKLLSMLDINDEDDNVLTINRKILMTQQSHLLDDVATVLGLKDKVIKGTEEDPDGGAYPDEIEKYMLDTYKYVSDNLYYIETLLHQFVLQGGISEGTFKTSDKDMIWKKVS